MVHRSENESLRPSLGYLCSATLNSLIPGVSRISRNTVGHQPKLKRQASTAVIQEKLWGGRDSNPRPTDYEFLAGVTATSENGELKGPITCKTALLVVAGTVAVRLACGLDSPPVAGVTPG